MPINWQLFLFLSAVDAAAVAIGEKNEKNTRKIMIKKLIEKFSSIINARSYLSLKRNSINSILINVSDSDRKIRSV